MTPNILKYPFDYTGVDPNNLVLGEEHTMVRRAVRAVATNHGPFFTQGLKVYDARYPTVPLVPGEPAQGGQYVAAELYAEATKRTGKEICAVIVITDPNVGDNIIINYQVVGGEFSSSIQVIADLVATLQLDNRAVKWGDILGKPDGFTPAHHLHDLGDVYGFEYVVDALERVRQAILMGDVASHDEIYRYIDHYLAEIKAQIAVQQQALDAHKADRQNPHGTNKVQVGLGLVENLPLASVQEAAAGLAQDRYMTPYLTRQTVYVFAEVPLANHVNNANNPHGTTAVQVGLGAVDNFSTASELEARGGTAANRFMTPLRTAQAIATQALVPLAAHINDTNNPHGVNKAQVGLSLVANYAPATAVEAVGSSNTVYMTPYTTRLMLDQVYWPVFTSHANNRSNPHGVTAEQTGAYTQAQTNYLLGLRLPMDGTAVNSQRLAGLDWPAVYNNTRANLDGGLITTGRVLPARLGANFTGAWSDILCSDGNWRPFTWVFENLGLNKSSSYWCGRTTNANAQATYASAPVGTILVVQVGIATEIGTGNGSYWTTYWYNYTWIKADLSNLWQQVTAPLHVATG